MFRYSAILWGLLPGAAAVAAPSPDYGRALALYQRTEYRAAVDLLQADRSGDAETLGLAGRAAFQLGEFERAQRWLERAVGIAPNSSVNWHWLGKTYGRRAETASFLSAPGLAGRCRTAFEKAVAADSRNVEAWTDLLEYYLEAPGILGGGLRKADATAARIEALDAAQGHYARSRIAARNKDWAGAERELRAALEAAPAEVGRAIDVAVFLAQRGRPAEADAMFERAARIDAGAPRLAFERAAVYIEGKRRLEEARALLEQYLKAAVTPDDPPKRDARKLLEKLG